MLFILTIQHFAVDGICGAALAAYAVNEIYFEPIIYYFGLYNLIAFGTQWLTGYLIDKKILFIKYAFVISLISLILGTISQFGILPQVILLGLGNSLFHVAGGSLVLRRYITYKELGIFVSSGAIGLALGLNMLCNVIIFVIIYTLMTMILLYRLREIHFEIESEIINSNSKYTGNALFAILGCIVLLLGCVILRGFSGGGSHSEYVMLFPCVFAAGKALGGILCDRIGYKNTILLIFIISFLTLQWDGLTAMLILTLAFNMTMPLTLRLVHFCNPNYPGLMFGLAAGCLLPGAFFYDNFNVIPQSMVVIQFLVLFIAGYIFKTYKQGQVNL